MFHGLAQYIHVCTDIYLVFQVAGQALVAQTVKSLAAVGDLGLIPWWGRSLEKEMAPHSSILAWRIPRTEEPGGLQSTVLQRVRHD